MLDASYDNTEIEEEFFVRWQRAILQTSLVSFGMLHLLLVSTHFVLSTKLNSWTLGAGTFCGFLFLFLSVTKIPLRLKSLLFLTTISLESVLLLFTIAWFPPVALLMLFVTIVSSLLLKNKRALFVPILFGLSMMVGGVLLKNEILQVKILANVTQADSWWRIAVLFALFQVVLVFFFTRFHHFIQTLEKNYRTIFEEISQQQETYRTLLKTRSELVDRVFHAQKLHSVAHLSNGIVQLVNNTLTIVRGAADRLLHPTDSESIRRLSKTVFDDVQNTASEIRRVLEHTRLEKQPPSPTLLTKELEQFQSVLEKSLPYFVQLEIKTLPTPPVLLEAQRFRQVLLNLVMNSREACSAGDKIQVALWCESSNQPNSTERHVLLRVIDNGKGMKEEVLQNALEPFFTTRRNAGHEGLGLSVVEELVKNWGGTLELHSKEGKGTSVTVSLPVLSEEELEKHSQKTTSSKTKDERSGSSVTSSSQPSSWRQETLEFSIRGLGHAFLLLLLSSLFLTTVHDYLLISLGVIGTCSCFFSFSQTQFAFQIRFLLVLLCLFCACSFAIVKSGFFAAAAVASLPLVLLLCMIYQNKGLIVFFVLASSLLFFLLPHTASLSSIQPTNVNPSYFKNWFRIGIMLPVSLMISASLVIRMREAIQRRVLLLSGSIHSKLDLKGRLTMEQAALLTSQNIAERAIRHEMTGKTIGAVTHDLNNSLSSVLGWAELLQDDIPPSAEELLEASHSFHKSAQIAASLVSKLMVTLKDKSADSVTPLDLKKEISSYKTVLENSARADIQIRFELSNECVVGLDKVDFQRVFLNLLTNSRHALRDGGTIFVRCQTQPETGKILFQVEDDGTGMDKETLERVLEAFFTTKTAGQGTGPGLFTVASIVEASGGTLSIDSSPDKGTTVTILWSALSETSEQDSGLLKVSPSRSLRGHVLLAEDNDAVRVLLAKGLERSGLTVHCADNALEALAVMKTREDWIALCADAVMPGVSSEILLRSFLQKFPCRPVLIVTGLLPPELEEIAENPLIRVVQKPVSPSELAAIVQEETVRVEALYPFSKKPLDLSC